MRNKRYTVLSFLKSKKIDYVDQLSFVVLPCVHCQSEVEMSYLTSFWCCSNCGHSGSLMTFVDQPRHSTKVKVFNPKKELRELNRVFNEVVKQHTNTPLCAELSQLQEKMNNFFLQLINRR